MSANYKESIDQSLARFKSALLKNADQCVPLIQKVLSTPPGKDFSQIQFEVQQGYDISINTFFKYNHQTVYKEFLPMTPPAQDLFGNIFPNESIKEQRDPFAQFLENIEASLTQWFVECWKKAGGLESSYPMYWTYRDDAQFLELKTGQKISFTDLNKKHPLIYGDKEN